MKISDKLIQLLIKNKTKSKPIQKEKVHDINFTKALHQEDLHAIYPFAWEQSSTKVQSGENYVRVIAVADYPKKVYGNWLSELRRKKGVIDIVQYIDSANSQSMIDYYRKTIQNKEAEKLQVHAPYKLKILDNYIKSANQQLDKYLENKATFIYQHMMIYLRAGNEKELDELTDKVKNTLIKLQMKPLIPVKAMFQGFWSTMPLNTNLLSEYTYRESNTDVASSMFPFDSPEILDLTPRSDIEGINQDTGSLVAIDKLDCNKTLNQNEVIIGTSGVGKTTYMIQKILRYAVQGYKIYIVDPENEYSRIVDKLGGAVIHLSSNSSNKINPLQIFSEELISQDEKADSMYRLVNEKIQRLKGFLETLKPDISQVEKAIMDDVFHQSYKLSGILQYSHIDEIKREQWPTLQNVYDELEKLKKNNDERFERVKDLYYILGSYVGGSNSLFNGATSVDLTSNIVSFDLKPLQNEHEVQEGAYLVTFQFLWDEITKDRTTRKKLFVDEFHFLTLHEQSATFFHQAYKRFRKYNAGAIAGTQQIQDVIEGRTDNGMNIGEAIIGNSFTKIFFGLDGKGVDEVISKLHMRFSDKEKKLLNHRRQGQCLIIYGGQRAFMNVELTEEELRLISPETYMEKYNRLNIEQPDYTNRITFTSSELAELNGE